MDPGGMYIGSAYDYYYHCHAHLFIPVNQAGRRLFIQVIGACCISDWSARVVGNILLGRQAIHAGETKIRDSFIAYRFYQ
ncbi:hypothetical protein SAMN04488123_11827 [Natribacillus halophilus]|uniref:Uncharacterized protein n=1 Tax=Natribacillus halophilus TaxID=549003 RepID=A0A1G8RIT4_9BACI|nr:hypothetical protein SAMN04488123_11827 [Natribacillus halophilus]